MPGELSTGRCSRSWSDSQPPNLIFSRLLLLAAKCRPDRAPDSRAPWRLSGLSSQTPRRERREPDKCTLHPAFLSHRERKRNPSLGKSDVHDAVAIARVVARGDGLASPQRSEVFQDLKLLTDHRDQLVRARTQLINRTHKDLVISHPGYEQRIPRLNSKKNLRAAMALLRGDRSTRAKLLRDRIAEIRRLDDKIAGIDKEIAAKVKASGTTLIQLRGIGFVIAAKILGEVGDVSRLRSKGSFAMLTGTAPLEASSGKTKRHRLNRGGNRQLNYALHMMALARRRGDADTKAYMTRLCMEGKSEKESMRCLKRHLSNVVFRQLVTELQGVQRAA